MSATHHVYTTIDAHDTAVAAEASAVRTMTTTFADRLRKAITAALNDTDGYEFAVSIARPGPDAEFVAGGPTRGNHPGNVGVHAPMEIVASGDELPDELRDEVSLSPTPRHDYADLIRTHTHNQHDGPTVGLSGADLKDAVPGPDYLDGPFDTYRAQSAIVFDSGRRIPTSGQDFTPSEETYIFDERPDARPWLHLIERTPEALSMDREETKALHMDTLEAHEEDPVDHYRSLRSLLGDRVAEITVPLSPSLVSEGTPPFTAV